MKTQHIAVAALGTLLLATSPLLAQGLEPEMPSCLPMTGNGVANVSLDPETEWTSVRTYFRALPDGTEHFVEMIPDGEGSYVGILPETAEETQNVESYVRATAADGSTASSPAQTIPVTSDCVAPVLSPELASAAAALTIGETSLDQSGKTPDGFKCTGVESRIDVNGIVGNHIACREERVAAAPIGSGLSEAARTALLVGGGVAIGAGVGFAIGEQNCEDCPVSPSTP